MQLTGDEQALLLAVTLGFATCVILLHLGESAILAARLHAWVPLLGSGMLLLAAVVLLVWRVGAGISLGVRFSDLLLIFGGQLGVLVCLPSRWLSRRKCQWDRIRTQRQLEAEWWHQAAQPQASDLYPPQYPQFPHYPNSPQYPQSPQPRPPIMFPGPFDRLSRLGRSGRQSQLEPRHAGVGAHRR
jgi:hypothetical protein